MTYYKFAHKFASKGKKMKPFYQLMNFVGLCQMVDYIK